MKRGKLRLGVTWEPNAPEAILLSDDAGRAALAQRAHFDDPDQRCVVLRWDGVLFAQMGPPNDEARPNHPLYNNGLGGLHWVGVVRDSARVASLKQMWSRSAVVESQPSYRIMPVHYVVLSKECVVEVLAENVDAYRVPGSPRQAAMVSLSR